MQDSSCPDITGRSGMPRALRLDTEHPSGQRAIQYLRAGSQAGRGGGGGASTTSPAPGSIDNGLKAVQKPYRDYVQRAVKLRQSSETRRSFGNRATATKDPSLKGQRPAPRPKPPGAPWASWPLALANPADDSRHRLADEHQADDGNWKKTSTPDRLPQVFYLKYTLPPVLPADCLARYRGSALPPRSCRRIVLEHVVGFSKRA